MQNTAVQATDLVYQAKEQEVSYIGVSDKAILIV